MCFITLLERHTKTEIRVNMALVHSYYLIDAGQCTGLNFGHGQALIEVWESPEAIDERIAAAVGKMSSEKA